MINVVKFRKYTTHQIFCLGTDSKPFGKISVHRYRIATLSKFIFLFNTGVRIGELAGLTWDNVDFKNNMLTIDKTVNRYRKKDFGFTMALASPKSRTSVRTIPMNNEVRKMLLKEKMRNAGPTMSIPFVDDSGNIRRQVSDIVFANSVGRVWNEPGKTKRWQIREVLILRRITQDKTR